MVASAAGHYMNVYRSGKLFARWPISSGRPGDDTPNGNYLTIEKANPVDMVGPGYNIEVPVLGAVHMERRLSPRRVLVSRRAGLHPTSAMGA